MTLLLTGACWLIVLSSLNTSAQRVAPGWVRARTLAAFQLVMQGGLAIGSLTWGLVTGAANVETALTIAAAGLVAGVALARRWPLAESEHSDLTPAGVWSDPSVDVEPRPEDGPVLITVEYEVDPVGRRALRLGDARSFAASAAATAPTAGTCTRTSSEPGATSRRSWSTRGRSTCASTTGSPWPTSS